MVQILMPHAERATATAVAMAPRLHGLVDARIGIVNNSWRCMDVLADELTRTLSGLGVGQVVEERISAAQTLPPDPLGRLASGCDAVVVGIGN